MLMRTSVVINILKSKQTLMETLKLSLSLQTILEHITKTNENW